MKTVLVIGATGVVGSAAIRRLSASNDVRLIGTSRTPRPAEGNLRWLTLDANDPADCATKLAQLPQITHVIYAAIAQGVEASSRSEEDANLQMMQNVLQPVIAHAREFRHVCVVHGAKAYGVMFGQPRLPFKESDPRYPESNFYYPQEAWLKRNSEGATWRWTILRPPMVCGFRAGSPMNALGVLGAYAAISQELGMPLRFPGGRPVMVEAVDVELLAEAIEWCGDEPRAGNEIFNVSNGDCFEWRALWPRIADVFGMRTGPDYPAPLARVMADKDPVWQRVVERHGLQPHTLRQIVPSWQFADFIFRNGNQAGSTLMSTIKIRKAGFAACEDTEEMYLRHLRALQRQKVLPRFC